METKAIVMGTFQSSSLFALYIWPQEQHSSLDFFRVKDLERVLNTHSQHWISTHAWIGDIISKNPMAVCKDQYGQCYILSCAVRVIAHRLQLYALSELCQLTHQQILAGVGDPLLSSVSDVLRQVTPHPYIKEHSLVLEWISLDRWYARPSPSPMPWTAGYEVWQAPPPNEEPTLLECMLPPKTENEVKKNTTAWILRLSQQRQQDPQEIQRTLTAAHRLEQQQQAIIASRAQVGRIDAHAGTTKKPRKRSCQRRPPPSLVTHSLLRYKERYTTSTSSIALVACAGTSTEKAHSPSLSTPKTTFKAVPQDATVPYNLDLLATQATKMKVLPLLPQKTYTVHLPPFQSVFSGVSRQWHHREPEYMSHTAL
ncbi:hypothetical protein BDF14DRAFT_1800356 [Spinellus fusiger]|nr:hypothetical protein BDF14DRAFT_1800356 [Spinellus fusiger]